MGWLSNVNLVYNYPAMNSSPVLVCQSGDRNQLHRLLGTGHGWGTPPAPHSDSTHNSIHMPVHLPKCRAGMLITCHPQTPPGRGASSSWGGMAARVLSKFSVQEDGHFTPAKGRVQKSTHKLHGPQVLTQYHRVKGEDCVLSQSFLLFHCVGEWTYFGGEGIHLENKPV